MFEYKYRQGYLYPYWFYARFNGGYLRGKDEAVVWCVDQFGPISRHSGWARNSEAVMFKDDAQATAFRMRWC